MCAHAAITFKGTTIFYHDFNFRLTMQMAKKIIALATNVIQQKRKMSGKLDLMLVFALIWNT